MGTKGVWKRPKSEYVTDDEIQANWDAVMGRDDCSGCDHQESGWCKTCGHEHDQDGHCTELLRQQKERS